MNPYNIHTETMLMIKLPNRFSLTVNPAKLSEHIAFWNGRGYSVIEGRPISSRKMRIKLIKDSANSKISQDNL